VIVSVETLPARGTEMDDYTDRVRCCGSTDSKWRGLRIFVTQEPVTHGKCQGDRAETIREGAVGIGIPATHPTLDGFRVWGQGPHGNADYGRLR
jgi:hypothetical protein